MTPWALGLLIMERHMDKNEVFASIMHVSHNVQKAGFLFNDPTLEHPIDQAIGELTVVQDDIERLLRILQRL